MGGDVKSRVPALFGIVKVRLFDIGLVLWGTNNSTHRSEPATDLQVQLGAAIWTDLELCYHPLSRLPCGASNQQLRHTPAATWVECRCRNGSRYRIIHRNPDCATRIRFTKPVAGRGAGAGCSGPMGLWPFSPARYPQAPRPLKRESRRASSESEGCPSVISSAIKRPIIGPRQNPWPLNPAATM